MSHGRRGPSEAVGEVDRQPCCGIIVFCGPVEGPDCTVLGRSVVYAVVRSGGRQYRASVGETVLVDRLSAPVGDQLELEDVLLIADGDEIRVGRPVVDGAKVIATVVGQEKGPKLRVFKYRPKQRYRRRAGHRQHYTRLRVDEISG